MKLRFVSSIIFAVFFLVVPSKAILADVVFTVNSTNSAFSERIVRSTPDGQSQQTLWSVPFSNGINPRGIAVDTNAGEVFWSDSASLGREVRKVPVTGGESRIALTRPTGSGTTPAHSMAIDSINRQMFLVEPLSGNRNIIRLNLDNLDNTSATSFYTNSTLSSASWLTINGGFLYFSNGADILRRALDGQSAATTLVSGLGDTVRGLTVDGDNLFWLNNPASPLQDTINVRSISASLSDPALSNSSAPIVSRFLHSSASATPHGLATDGTFLFFADQGSSSALDRIGIFRAPLDFAASADPISGVISSTRIVTLSSGEVAQGIAFVAAVPEPSSAALLFVSIAAFSFSHLRNSKNRRRNSI